MEIPRFHENIAISRFLRENGAPPPEARETLLVQRNMDDFGGAIRRRGDIFARKRDFM